MSRRTFTMIAITALMLLFPQIAATDQDDAGSPTTSPGPSSGAITWDTREEFDTGVYSSTEGVDQGPAAAVKLAQRGEWVKLAPAGGPSSREGHVMVYDESAQKFVLFGGRAGSAIHRDTWLYDPIAMSWTEVPTVDPPPARVFAAATYDAERGKVVMFGGSDATGSPLLGDTWEYDTAINRWNPVGAGTAPSARKNAALAFDRSASASVLFGGEVHESWTVSGIGGLGPYSTIAVDSTGKPHVGFFDGAGVLRYASYVGTGGTGCSVTSWTCTTVDSGGVVGVHASIALDSLGRPRISYFDVSNTALKYAAYVQSGGTGCATVTWACVTVDSGGASDAGRYNALALDSSGNPQISYLNDTSDDLRHARFVGSGGTGCAISSWTCTTVDSAGAAGSWSSIVLDSLGNAHVSYYAASPDLDLRYAKYVAAGGTGCASVAWSCTIVDSSGTVGSDSSIAVDSWNLPWISYYAGATTDLKVARYVASGGSGCALASWDCTIVDQTGGAATSIVLDPSGIPRVSYYAGGLRYAEYVRTGGVGCQSAAWSCQTLESGDAGSVTSIDLAPDGATWFSHYSPGAGNLLVSRRGPSDETWTLGATWSKMSPFTKPTSRAGHWMTYDESEGVVLMGGGTRGGGELWSVSGGGSFWTIKDTAMFPETKGLPNAVYETSRSRLIVSMAGAPGVAETVVSTGNVGSNPSIQIDGNETPHIAYHRADGGVDLELAELVGSGGVGCETTGWRCDLAVSTGSAGLESSLRFTSGGSPRISFGDGAGSNLVYAAHVGSGGVGCGTAAWTCTTVDSAAFVVSETSLALDSGNVPHISYYNGPGVSDLKFAEFVGSGGTGCATAAWTCTTVDSAANVGSYSSLALDASGNPHISYFDGSTSDLKFAEYVGAGGTGCATAAWKCTVVDSTGTTGWYTSIALDAFGNPRIGYHDVANWALRFAGYVGTGGTGCATTEWSCTTVEAGPVPEVHGWAVSLALDSWGKPVISHNDDGNRDLRLANYVGRGGTGCANPAWTCRILEAPGDVGSYTSLDLDASDGVHLAYYRSTQTDLRYLHFSGDRTADTTWTYESGTALPRVVGYPGPAARRHHSMAHDSVLDSTLMFGGSRSDGSELGDLWAWSAIEPLGDWTSQGVSAGSERRSTSALAGEPVRWTDLSWIPRTPTVGGVKFQVATSDDNSTWSYSGPDGTASTYYSVSGVPLNPATVGRYASIRAFLDTGYSHLSPELDSVTLGWNSLEAPAARVISPNGGEDWIYGRTYPITWHCVGAFGLDPVALAYSTDSGDSWTSITSATANDGTYNWTVPNYDTPNAMVRATCADLAGRQSADTSDASFAIDPPPSMAVQFSSPSAGEVWGAGGHTVSWDPTYLTGPVDLDFTTDAGVSWSPIVHGTPNLGAVPWELTPLNSRAAQVRISGVDQEGIAVSSTGPFFVIDSSPPLLSGLRSTTGPESALTLEITVTDNFEVRQVSLNVARRGVDGFVSVPMERAGDRYFAAIESAEGISAYYVSATDGANTATTPIQTVATGTSITPAAAAIISSMALLLGVASVLVLAKMKDFRQNLRPKGKERTKK